MAAWLNYSPTDFLMFGPEVYWRLFELQNRALWPAPLLALAAGLAMLLLVARPGRRTDRAVWLFAALGWVGAAAFLSVRYAPINWAMGYTVWAFWAQALLIGLAGVAANLAPRRAAGARPPWPGLAILAYAVMVHPLIGLGFGRPLVQAEIVGLAPDPTAIATLGLTLAAGRGWRAIALAIVPAVWCALSAATLFTLGSAQGWIPLAALGLWAGSRARLQCGSG